MTKTTRRQFVTNRCVRLAVVGLLVLLLPACGETDQPKPAERPPLVEAVEARSGGLPLEETVYGVVRARNQVEVRPEVSAAVADVFVRSGESVQRGQILVRLQDDVWKEQLRRSEADLRLAEASAAETLALIAELEARTRRAQSLAEDDLVSPQELESLVARLAALRAASRADDARVEQARAVIAERRSALAKTQVRSPVSGRVGERRVEIGMLVDSDTVLFPVGTLDRVIVEVTLTEEMLAHVRPGQPVLVRPRNGGAEPIKASLTRVSPFLAADSFTTVGEIDLDNPDLRLGPGMFVSVQILYGTSEVATLVPTSALWEDPGTSERGVFVVEDPDGLEAPTLGQAENPERARSVSFRQVDILAEGRGLVGLNGVDAGDWVVIAGQHLLRRNMRDGATAGNRAADITEARIRPTTWERVSALQNLQREDLLNGFLDKQQRIARALGADIPDSESVVTRVLAEGASGSAEAQEAGPGER